MEYNPYELIYMSRIGEETALAALFAQYQSYFQYLRNTVAKRNCVNSDAYDEMLLEMRIGVSDACERYREDEEASWRTFLTIVLKRRAVNVLRKADVRDWMENTLPFEALIQEDETVYDCFAQTDSFAEPEYCLHYAEAGRKLAELIARMDPEEKAYVALWAANAKGRQGSEKMNCTEKNWYKRMDRVKKKVYAGISAEETA
jgi:DNA-directed RNA polymerase specialized sigma24 family protein